MKVIVNRISLFCAALWLSLVVGPAVSGMGRELDKWAEIMSSKEKKSVFEAIDAATPVWPKVYSLEKIKSMKDADRQEQEEYHSIASSIIHDAKGMIEGKSGRSSNESWRKLESALTLRDRMLANAGYVNLVLADGINRAAFVYLCKELGSEGPVSPEFEKSLFHLLAYSVNIDQLAAITRDELAWNREKLEDIVGSPVAEIGLHKLWDRLSDGDRFEFPKNIGHMSTDDLLQHRDISMLLYRYIYSDIMMKRLSLAVRYKKQTAVFSLTDGRGQIENVLPELREGARLSIVVTGGVSQVITTEVPVDKASLSVGERFISGRSSSDDVVALLKMIKSGAIDNFLPLYREARIQRKNVGGVPLR
jgi:hypothetical protein